MTNLGSGEYTYQLSGKDWGDLPKSWRYKEGTAVAVNSKDNVYVFNRGGHPIIIYDSDGKFLSSWGDDIFTNPHGIAIGPDDSVYCVDAGDHTIRKFTKDGDLLMTLGDPHRESQARGGKPFNKPTHIAVDPRNGDLFVSDGYSNARVHRFSPDGHLIESWGESGTFPGHFNIVHNIAIDRDGWIYVADRDNRRIQVFDIHGNYEAQWINLSRAATVYVDTRHDDQIVYVGEYFAGGLSNADGLDLGPRITIFNTRGRVLARLGRESFGDEPGRFYAPHGIAVDSSGDIYVAEVSWSEFGSTMEPERELRSLQKLTKIRS